MRALGAGNKEDVLMKVIKRLINTTQGNQFETYLDDEGIRDIADVLQSDKPLYAEGEGIETMIDAPSKKQLKDPAFLRDENPEEEEAKANYAH